MFLVTPLIVPYHALAFRLPCGSQVHNTYLSVRLVTKHCGKAHDAAFGVDTHSNTIRRSVTHEQHNSTLRICVVWTTASRTKRCPFRSVIASTFTTKHPLRRRILENGSSAALHHHSLTNEKFKSFAALRQHQEMNPNFPL